jgi:hypothetical protein
VIEGSAGDRARTYAGGFSIPAASFVFLTYNVAYWPKADVHEPSIVSAHRGEADMARTARNVC